MLIPPVLLLYALSKAAVRIMTFFATKTESTEENGVNQSAFGTIREVLLKKEIAPAQFEGILEAVEYNTDDLAEKVVEKLKPLLEEKNYHLKH